MPRLLRYGGEEFCVLLPTTNSEGAQTVASKMREAVHSLAIPNETSAGLHVSISVGIATCYFPTNLTAHQLLETADKALYRAKKMAEIDLRLHFPQSCYEQIS